jgi:hypothetical protein
MGVAMGMATDGTAGIRQILRPGERVLWQGQPIHRAFQFRGGSWFLVPFTFIWLAFAVFWEVTAFVSHAPAFFLLWGGMFVVFGLYISIGRFYVAGREAKRTIYAVTDQRILIIGGGIRTRLQELSLRTLPPPSLDQGTDGVGTITFGPGSPWGMAVPAGWPGMSRYGPAFVGIADASRVFKVIDDAVAAARSQP